LVGIDFSEDDIWQGGSAQLLPNTHTLAKAQENGTK
jgi:hypothetical protein